MDLLENWCSFLPINEFVSSSEKIIGIPFSQGLKLGMTGTSTKVYLDNLRISPEATNLSTFDEELLDIIQHELCLCANRKSSLPHDSLKIHEKHLKVFYHNRQTPIEPIPIVYLDTYSESERGNNRSLRRQSLHSRILPTTPRSATNGSPDLILMARNPVQLDIPNDPDGAVVFLLEYTLTVPKLEGTKPTTLSTTDTTNVTFTIRWGTCAPFADVASLSPDESVVNLSIPLKGTPDQLLVPSELRSDSDPATEFTSYLDCLRQNTCPDGTFCFKDRTKAGGRLLLTGTASIGRRIQTPEPTPIVAAQPISKTEAAIQQQISKSVFLEVQRATSSRNSLESATESPMATRRSSFIKSPGRRRSSSKINPHQQLQMEPQQQQMLQQNQGLLNSMPPIQPNSSSNDQQLALYQQLLQQVMQQNALQHQMPPGNFMMPPNPMMIPNSGMTQPVIYQPMHATNSGTPVTLVSQARSGVGLTRAAQARLREAGFQQITTDSGEAAQTLDPQSDPDPSKAFNYQKEAADPRCMNEILVQFLAYSCPKQESVASGNPLDEVYFTLQFYRFPQVKTERLRLGKELNDSPDQEGLFCRVLERMDAANTKQKDIKATPLQCCQTVFTLDPNFLKPGEYDLFFTYLLRNNLHLDVWNAKSHLLIGYATVELKHLCRQGREAVQVTYSLDILSADGSDDSKLSGDQFRGRLHLRLANVGHEPITSGMGSGIFEKKSAGRLISADASHTGFRGGALSDAGLRNSNEVQPRRAADGYVVRARPLVSVSQELRELLQSGTKRGQNQLMQENGRQSERDKKLSRLHAALRAIGKSNEFTDHTALSGVQLSGLDRATELSTVQLYREQKKRENIERLLANTNVRIHRLDTSFGQTEFFEFELKNSTDREDTVQIQIEDEHNNTLILTDSREVRALKMAFGIQTPTEDDLFAVDVSQPQNLADTNQSQPLLTVFLKPRETVRIPIKYMESSMLPAQSSVLNANEDSYPNGPKVTTKKAGSEDFRSAKITFQSSITDRTISQLVLQVHIYPVAVDQTFRFFHPELSYLKKLICLPANQPTRSKDSVARLCTRASDSSVIIESGSEVNGQLLELLIKVGLDNSPQVREFLIAVYLEPFQMRPAYIWHWVVHALSRVDAVATLGQLSPPLGLLIRADNLPVPTRQTGQRSVSVHTNHPEEVLLSSDLNAAGSSLNFVINARAVYELKVRVQPRRIGTQNYQLNVVDTDLQQVIKSWMLCVEVKEPEVSKTFNIQLPLLGRQNTSDMCHKRVPYSNPYPTARQFRLSTNRPDLVQFKESDLQVAAGGVAQLGLRFIPQVQPGTHQLYVFVQNDKEQTEETFSIVTQYV